MSEKKSLGRPRVAEAVAALHRCRCLRPLATFTPVASMLTMLTTVVVCLRIWRKGPAAVPGLIFPAISELGADSPTRRIYQVGFALCGALLSLSALAFEELLAPHLLRRPPSARPGAAVCVRGLKSTPELNGVEGFCDSFDAATGRWTVELPDVSDDATTSGSTENHQFKKIRRENLEVLGDLTVSAEDVKLWHSVLWWCHASCAGIVLQGVFTLRRDITPECFVHWGGAILFMMGAMQHGKASNQLYQEAIAGERCQPLLLTRGVQRAAWFRRIILDYSSIVLFMIPLLMQVWPRATSEKATTKVLANDKGSAEAEAYPVDTMNIMGLCQWGIILQFAVYFLTYTVDMRTAASFYSDADRNGTLSSTKQSE